MVRVRAKCLVHTGTSKAGIPIKVSQATRDRIMDSKVKVNMVDLHMVEIKVEGPLLPITARLLAL
jgi:hypothetical protein